jgi:hypothetical protein
MLKKIVMIGLLAAVVAVSGCKKKEGEEGGKGGGKAKGGGFTCDSVFAKNKKCAEAIVGAMTKMAKAQAEKSLEKLPEAAKTAAKAKIDENIKKMIPQMKAAFVGDKFLEQCKKNWDSKEEKDVKMKGEFKKCFAKSDCKEYAQCIMDMVKK